MEDSSLDISMADMHFTGSASPAEVDCSKAADTDSVMIVVQIGLSPVQTIVGQICLAAFEELGINPTSSHIKIVVVMIIFPLHTNHHDEGRQGMHEQVQVCQNSQPSWNGFATCMPQIPPGHLCSCRQWGA